MSDNSVVYGKALYLELEQGNGGSVLQLILTPDMQSPTGAHVPMALYRRRVTPVKSRTVWTAYSTYDKPAMEDGKFAIATSKSAAISDAKVKMTFADKLFTQIIDHGYKLRKQPIVVEISVADLDDLCSHKTPYKLLTRVTRTRKLLGFPDSLV